MTKESPLASGRSSKKSLKPPKAPKPTTPAKSAPKPMAAKLK